MPGYFDKGYEVPRGGWQQTAYAQQPRIGYGYGSMNPAWLPDFPTLANAAPRMYFMPRYGSGGSAITESWSGSAIEPTFLPKYNVYQPPQEDPNHHPMEQRIRDY